MDRSRARCEPASDRLVDALVAWGDELAIRARAAEHLDAGATRTVVFDFDPKQGRGDGRKLVEALAPARN
jgi:hypothetical protein